MLHFLEVIELAIAKAWWAIGFIAINAEVAVLVACDNGFTSEALAGGILSVLSDHALLILSSLSSVPLDALELGAETKTLFLSSMKNELVSKVFNNIETFLLEFLNIEVFDALMVSELGSSIFLVTNLAHHENFGTIVFDMLVKLSSSQVLEFFSVADVAAEFWAVELSMCLELSESLPDDFSSSISVTFMWELAEIDTVFEYLVYFLKEVASCLAVWTANIIVWSGTLSHLLLNMGTSSVSAS